MTEAQKDKSIKTMRELLGMNPEELVAADTAAAKAPPSSDLPIAEPEIVEEPKTVPEVLPVAEPVEIVMKKIEEPKVTKARGILAKDLVRYPIIFVIALIFFYTILNFSSVVTQITGLFNKPESPAMSAVPEDFDVSSYQRWIKKYYVYLNDPQELAAEEDPDGDGLINSQEFKMETNPLLADTDWDGFDDGHEVLGGYNPLYLGRLLPWQEKIVAEEIDLSSIASRKQLEQVSGSTISVPPSSVSPSPSIPSSAANPGPRAQLPADNKFLVDISKPGNLKIPRLGVDAQITWSKEFSQMEEDLKYGVAHHPATPYPGAKGTSSIHGHSSGNPWDGNFKTIFTKLNFLEAGDEIFVTLYGTNSETRKYRLMVRRGQVYAKDDKAQFNAGDGYFLNLSTSWPIGTARQRYVVTTELVGLQP